MTLQEVSSRQPIPLNRLEKLMLVLVSHGDELTYVFGEPLQQLLASVLSKNMMDYWISFATNLDPNDQFGNASRTLRTFCPDTSQATLTLSFSVKGPVWAQYNSSYESEVRMFCLVFYCYSRCYPLVRHGAQFLRHQNDTRYFPSGADRIYQRKR